MSVEIADYLNEIDASSPCGEDLEYDPDFIALEQAAKGKAEQQIGDTIQEAEPPDWKEVKKLAESLLTRTHDLRVSMTYLRALSALHGFPGMAQGLDLLKQLTETYWENIYPQLDPDDDNDPTERVNILMSLCDFETSLKPLQRMVMVESKAFGRFSLRDLHLAEGHDGSSDSEAGGADLSSINGAFQDCDSEQLKETAEALRNSIQSLNDLEKFVTEQVGVGDAPSFTDFRKILKEVDQVVSQWVSTRGLDAGAEDDSDVEQAGVGVSADGGGKVSITAVGGINNSDDVRRTLNMVCEYYRKNEPSSPVPILLQRVIRLVGKDFMDIMKDMAPGGVEQVEFLSGSHGESSSSEE